MGLVGAGQYVCAGSARRTLVKPCCALTTAISHGTLGTPEQENMLQ